MAAVEQNKAGAKGAWSLLFTELGEAVSGGAPHDELQVPLRALKFGRNREVSKFAVDVEIVGVMATAPDTEMAKDQANRAVGAVMVAWPGAGCTSAPIEATKITMPTKGGMVPMGAVKWYMDAVPEGTPWPNVLSF